MSSCTKWHSVLHIARCLQLLIRMLGKQDESKILQKLNKIYISPDCHERVKALDLGFEWKFNKIELTVDIHKRGCQTS